MLLPLCFCALVWSLAANQCCNPGCTDCGARGEWCTLSKENCIGNCKGVWCGGGPPGPNPPPPPPPRPHPPPPPHGGGGFGCESGYCVPSSNGGYSNVSCEGHCNSGNCRNGITAGTLQIYLDGMATSFTVVGTQGNNISDVHPSGTSITLKHLTRAYLATGCHSSFNPDMFLSVKLLGKTISWTADISQANCGCNAAFYLTQMPGYGSNGRPAPSEDGDYYCDANDIGGIGCPEMDLQEANSYASQTTPHKCSSQSGKKWNGCDGDGCGVNTHSGASYGPGSHYTINTQKPYQNYVYFSEKNGKLDKVEIGMSQNGHSITMNPPCDDSYLEAFGQQISSGMSFIFSYWGSTMTWLDKPPCQHDSCDPNSQVTFSDISIY